MYIRYITGIQETLQWFSQFHARTTGYFPLLSINAQLPTYIVCASGVQF